MKRILLILLALAMLSGCGKEEADQTELPRLPEATQTVTSPAAQETSPATQAPTDPDGIPEGQEAVTEPAAQTQKVYRPVRMNVQEGSGADAGYETYTYDEQGRITGSRQFDADGNPVTSTVTTYAENGDYETAYTSGDFSYTVRYTLDEMGNIVEDETIENGKVVDRNVRTFDRYGNQLTLRMGDSSFSYEYTYDDSGSILKRMEYQDGALMGWLEMTYDDRGRAESAVYYLADGTVSHSTRHTWEANTEKRSYCDADGSVYMTIIESYDDQGNTVFRETWQGDAVVSRVEYIYEPIEIPAV